MEPMSWWSHKSVSRREHIRKDRPDHPSRRWQRLRSGGVIASIQIAAVFWVLATSILMLRDDVVPYRPGQWAHHDILARVDFTYMDNQKLADLQRKAREDEPHVYTEDASAWKALEEKLLALPDRASAVSTPAELGADLRGVLDGGSFTKLKEYHNEKLRPEYARQVKGYIDDLRRLDPNHPDSALIILPDEARLTEVDSANDIVVRTSPGAVNPSEAPVAARVKSEITFSPSLAARAGARDDGLQRRLEKYADENFELALQPKIVALTLAGLKPTYLLDEPATAEAQNRAANLVASTQGEVLYKKNQVIVPRGPIGELGWQLLRAENEKYIQSLDQNRVKQTLGIAGIVLIITCMLAAYIARFQPRIIRKHPRAIAIVALLLSMLLLAQLAGIGTSPLYVFGIAPTILVAMIMAIVYEQRFALGVGTFHAVLVTLALGQGLGFFVILFSGIATCCFLLDDIRTRSRLIEIGGVTALAMMGSTVAVGLLNMDPLAYTGKNCLYTGAAGIAAGFIVLGVLPIIEGWFRITTSMTLLELADASHRLLRRLQVEAPGTYNHSLQVANIAEACAEAIGANSLLCRVASYYHDVGKINKADYFCENQIDGANRHINLSPSVSLLIIIGHVKDGVELAKEYDLPTSIIPFIQQHHGTTLVEFFYHQAVTRHEQAQSTSQGVSEVQYRYPGPKPRTREIAILMIADCVESATRAMTDPASGRIEALVHELIMKRLLDGQFDDCDLTMHDLQKIERTCIKSLLSIYHGRIAYPSSPAVQSRSASVPAPTTPAVRTA
jgi:putative nucleotidyltransferase with HDIG domain